METAFWGNSGCFDTNTAGLGKEVMLAGAPVFICKIFVKFLLFDAGFSFQSKKQFIVILFA